MFTPSTLVFTKTGWRAFRSLSGDFDLLTVEGWKSVTLNKKKVVDSTCYLVEKTHFSLELLDKAKVVPADLSSDYIDIMKLYTDAGLKSCNIKLGRFGVVEDVPRDIDNRDWCLGYILSHLFFRGSSPKSSPKKALIAFYDKEEQEKFLEILEVSGLNHVAKTYKNLNAVKSSEFFLRVIFDKSDFYGWVNIDHKAHDTVLRMNLDDFNPNILNGFVYSVLERINKVTLSDGGKSLHSRSIHKAKVIDYIVSRYTQLSSRIVSNKTSDIVLIRESLDLISIELSLLTSVPYSGYIYTINEPHKVIVKGSFDSFPAVLRS